MKSIFPEAITKLPEANIPLPGSSVYLSQSATHQVLFMQFEEDVDLPKHSHEAQVGFVLEGRIDLTIAGVERTFTRGERYSIPAGVEHSGKIYAGYADITFFDQPDRYALK